MLLRLLNDRWLWQPITLEDPIDRNGVRRCVVGSASARQNANAACDKTAENASCSYFFEALFGYATHGPTPKSSFSAQTSYCSHVVVIRAVCRIPFSANRGLLAVDLRPVLDHVNGCNGRYSAR